MNRKIIAYLLILCLTVTSCIGFTPKVWAETAADVVQDSETAPEISQETEDADVPEDPEITEPSDEPSEPETPTVPDEPSELEILDGWHDGLLYKDGELFTGWMNSKYYKSGKLFTGWMNSKYYKSGKLFTGWMNSKYYKSGKLFTGWKDSKYYKSGKLFTGWMNSKYYKSGKVCTGWSDGKYYRSGKLYTGWIDGKYYKSGKLYTGWKDSKYYKSGKLLTGVAVNSKGVPYYYVKGVKQTNTKYMYNNRCYQNGKLYTGILKTDKGVFYYKKGVKSTTIIYTYNGKKYKNGKLYSGLYDSYYYSNGKKFTGYKNKVKRVSTGEIHYFKKDGSVCRGNGWWRLDGKRYYFKNGYAYKGWKYIGGYKYYFHLKTGTLCQDLIACQGNKWKKADLKIRVNRQKNCVTIYAKDGNKGYTIPVKAMICSVGKKETPTITGTYTLKNESGRIFRWHLLGGPDMGGYVYGQYAVRINGGYMFHSVTYREKDNRTFIASTYNNLGGPASHGCVRLQVIDAKLIYDIVKYRDTKVEIYDSSYTGPFDKPVIRKIPSWQNYEPTDPSI